MATMLRAFSTITHALTVSLVVIATGAPLQAAGHPPTTADTLTSAQAQRLFVRGLTQAYLENHDRAIRLYERALELAPNEAPILSAMADAQEALEETSTALFYAEQARTLAPENTHYYRQLAELHEAADNTEAAIQAYRDLTSRFPDDLDARLTLARKLADQHRSEEALSLYESAEQQMGGATPQMYMTMLQLYRRMHDTENVGRVLRALVELRPDEQLFTQLLGQFYMKEGEVDNAVALYEETLATHPDNVEALLELADLYREQGRAEAADSLLNTLSEGDGLAPEQLVRRAQALLGRGASNREATRQATRLLEQALDQQPNHEDALQLLGELRYQAGAFAEAATLLQRALDQNPRVVQRWVQAGASYLQAGQPQQAVELAEEGLLIFPDHLSLVRIAARGLLDLNRNEAAIEQFENLHALMEASDEPADRRADVLATLGLLYNRVGDLESSDQAYQDALALDDQHAMALNNYAYSLSQRGVRLDEAASMARRAVELDENNASYLDTLGWIYFQQEAYDEAEKWLKRALDAGEASATVYEHYGDVQKAMGNPDAARTYWQRALEQAPDREALREKLDAHAP